MSENFNMFKFLLKAIASTWNIASGVISIGSNLIYRSQVSVRQEMDMKYGLLFFFKLINFIF